MNSQLFYSEEGPYSSIVSVAKALPNRCVTNRELVEKGIDTSDEWIVQRTGIHQRYIAQEGQTSSYFANQAAKKVLKASQLSALDIHGVIVATSTPDYDGFPSVACIVQAELRRWSNGAITPGIL